MRNDRQARATRDPSLARPSAGLPSRAPETRPRPGLGALAGP